MNDTAVLTVYTVGHSNRRIDELMGLLRHHQLQTLVDLRAHPRSRHNPQFNEPALRRSCLHAGLAYHWAGRQLGGRRRVWAHSPHSALEPGLRGFADYMHSDAFVRAVDRLLSLARRQRCALLCAEYDPANCHRALIADYLSAQGHAVIHLLDEGESRSHRLHPNARWTRGNLIYDRFASGELDLTE